MLYIKTTAAANRLNLQGVRTVYSESAGIAPTYNTRHNFELNWHDNGLFHRADTSSNGLRCTYERYRRIYRDEIKKNMDAQNLIQQICSNVQNGFDIILTVTENRKFPNSTRRLLVELFYACGLTDEQIQSDKNIVASKVRAMDALTTKPAVNATLHYEYQDNTGDTMQNIVTVIGEISQQQIDEILGACKNGREFVPNGVGLPLTRATTPYNAAKDHPWAHFLTAEMSFKNIETTPDEEYTIEDLVKQFKKVEKHWDAIATERKSREDYRHQ